MIAKIAVEAANFAIDKPYSYNAPRGTSLLPGMRVQVPFGRGNRRTEGVVISVEEGSDAALKYVEKVLDEEPILTDGMLRLAAFMRERYFCTFFDAVKAMLPAGLWFRTKESYALTDDMSWVGKSIRIPGALQILQVLKDCGGEAEGTQLRGVTEKEVDFEKAVSYLLRKKWIRSETDFLRRLGDKTEKIATLAVSSEETLAYAASRPKSAAMQKGVLELLCSVGSAAVKEICYFTGAKPTTVKRLAELGYLELSEKPVLRCRQIVPATLDGPLILNTAQQIAFDGLHDQLISDTPGSALLYGVTGSGKTSVYIQLIRACLDAGKQAMLLVPEIALTPQLLGLLAAYFGEKVAVLHSSLPSTERYDQWKRLRQGQATVVVGTRSAVFAPCPDLGSFWMRSRSIPTNRKTVPDMMQEKLRFGEAQRKKHWCFLVLRHLLSRPCTMPNPERTGYIPCRTVITVVSCRKLRLWICAGSWSREMIFPLAILCRMPSRKRHQGRNSRSSF